MIALILCAGLALAEPDPSIAPPPVVVHPEELPESVEVTEPGEAEVKADGELVDPETVVVLERKDPTPFQRIISGFVWVMSFFVIAPYEDEALTLVVAGLFAEARLWLDRKRRQRKDTEDDSSERLGALQERTLRNLASDLVQQEISELTNLQQTQIGKLVKDRDAQDARHAEALAQLRAAHAEQLANLVPLAETLEALLRQSTEEPA